MITNNKNPYSLASSAYRDSNTSTMSGFDIVVELYRGIINNIEQAKASYKEGRLDTMCNQIEKTNKILIALQSHLNFDQGGDAANVLNHFYTTTFGDLTSVLRKDNPEEEFDRIIGNIRPVYEIWCRHAANEKSAPSE